MKWFTRLFIAGGLFIFGGISVMILFWNYGLPWKHAEMKKEMTSYLEQRYLDEFELDNIRFDFMHDASYYTYATAASTGVTFYVARSNDGAVEDGYGYEHWSHFGESLLKRYVPNASIISTDVTFDEPLPENKSVVDHLAHTCWTASIDMPFSLTEENKEDELRKLLHAIQNMHNDGICFESMSVGYEGQYVELEKEQLQHIDTTEQLTVTEDVENDH